MEGFLSMDNILSGDEAASLFDTEEEAPDNEETAEETQDNNETTEVNPDTLFDEEKPESVGSEDEDTGEGEDTSSEEDGTSPNFYSSIANALKEEGVFPDLDDNDIDSIVEPEDFRDLIEQQIQAAVGERQQMIYDALNAGVQPNQIMQYENTLNYLSQITKDILNEETQRGEQVRRQLLQQDFLNRGYSQERAVKMTEKLFDSGDDIEEAIQALDSNKAFFGQRYQSLLDEAKAKQQQQEEEQYRQAEEIRNSIMSQDKVFDSIPVDKKTRQQIYDVISKPVYKDPETGQYYTEIQQYRLEHENEFIKNVGILYTLTNGFQNIEKLISPQAKKQVKSKLRELEHTINNTQRDSGGKLNYVGSSGNYGDTLLGNDFSIDI